MRSLLAVALFAAVLLLPADAGAVRIYAVTATQSVWFDSSQPDVPVGSSALTGIGAGESIMGIDWRPSTGRFLLLTRQGSTGRLYDFEPSTGAASNPRLLTADPTDATAPYTGLTIAAFGMDVNPVPDRVRLVSTSEQNLRVNPDTGATITDANINPAGHAIAGVAYSNPDADPATGTGLFDYGYNSDDLYQQNPPNDGVISVIGTGSGLTVTTNPGFVHLDIAQNGGAFLTGLIGGDHRLARVDLVTGLANLIGLTAVDGILGMAAVNNTISVADTAVSVSEGAGAVDITLVRDTPADKPSSTVNVGVTATAGSAGASDFGAVPTEIGFGNGETIDKITIPITDDTADEPSETFTVAIEGGPAAPTAEPRTATVTIADDDPQQVTTVETQTVTQTVPGPSTTLIPPITVLGGRCANAQTGTRDDDALAGTSAGDRLSGGLGADGISGGAGDDCLLGGPGDDLLLGNAGADDLRGEGGNDVLRGGAGNDALRGGGGSNRVAGGGGADVVSAANGRRDVVDCGTGRDRVTADRRDRLRGCERVTRRR